VNAGPHLDDDRLSALIDGEATPDDLAHAAGCSECSTLVAAWREASQLVASPAAPPPAAQRDAAVEAALNAAVAPAAAPDDDPGPGPVSLATRRYRAKRRAPRAVIGSRIAAAAAAVIVIAGLAVAVDHSGGSSSKSSSAAGPAASQSTTQVPAVTPSTRVTPSTVPQPNTRGTFGSTSGTASSGRPQALGSYQSPASLVAPLRAALARTPSASNSTAQQAPSPVGLARCQSGAAADAGVKSSSVPALVASLTYQGAPAQVFVFTGGTGHVAVVVSGPGCVLLTHLAF
jgi:hypothetical protein